MSFNPPAVYPQLHFHGAAHGVTGSCFLLELGHQRLLVDCGLFQGSNSERELNKRDFPFDPTGLTAVLLTHAHIDHSGLLPKLVKQGFEGPIYAVQATVDLCSVMLPDSGHIQESEAGRRNRRGRLGGKADEIPIYTAVDAIACLSQFRAVGYGDWQALFPGARARFWNAGHMLGSASIELEVEAAAQTIRLLFSGDIGPVGKLLQPDPVAPSGFDYIVCEATYGAKDRDPASEPDRRIMLCNEVQEASRRGGALLIPSFAVERTQEVLVDLVSLMQQGRLPEFPVYIDSPLASRASAVFRRHAGEIESGDELIQALESSHVHFTQSVEESIGLDDVTGFHVVIAASGMCDAGRIRHRLKNWLWRPQATVLFVGFQAAGSLGRVIQDGASAVRIHGESIVVAASIRTLDLYSGHADGPELLDWISKRLPLSSDIFLVHGEDTGLKGLEKRIAGLDLKGEVFVPILDSSYALTPSGAVLTYQPDSQDRSWVGRPDSTNELSELFLEISDAVARAADERAKAVVVRRLKRALEQQD